MRLFTNTITDAEIIKALECCTNTHLYTCDDCPFYQNCQGDEDVLRYALALINRQKTEIEEHKKRCFCCGEKTTKTIINLQELLAEQKAEIERLNKEISTFDVFYFCSYSGCEAVSNECWKTCPNSVYNKTRAESIREFAERLKTTNGTMDKRIVSVERIDNLVKEMVGNVK